MIKQPKPQPEKYNDLITDIRRGYIKIQKGSKTELDNCEFSLATGVWKHNVNVNLVRAKEELDRLIKHRAIKE